VLDWFDVHSGSIVGVSTIVLVVVTAYYAWTTRALVRESRSTLIGAGRATLQERMDRISALCIEHPGLFEGLQDPNSTGDEQDGRFHLANMFLGVLEEAYMQHAFEHSMSEDDWSAWVATADVFLPRPFITRYWQRVAPTFEPGFQRFIDERLRASAN
jgi:hypothetical protein